MALSTSDPAEFRRDMEALLDRNPAAGCAANSLALPLASAPRCPSPDACEFAALPLGVLRHSQSRTREAHELLGPEDSEPRPSDRSCVAGGLSGSLRSPCGFSDSSSQRESTLHRGCFSFG